MKPYLSRSITVAMLWRFFLHTPAASADPPQYVLRQNAVIGTAPDGRPVRSIYYFGNMCQHFQYLVLLTMKEQEWPEAIEACGAEGKGEFCVSENEEAGSSPGRAFTPDVFDQRQGWDTSFSWYFSPDGMFFYAYEVLADIYDGDGWRTARRFAWTGSGYEMVSETRISIPEAAMRRIEEALISANERDVLEAFSGLQIGGRSNELFAYPPQRLVLPLWHFFRYRAGLEGGIAALEEFLDKAVFGGRSLDEPNPTLEGFLRYSLAIPGVREHIEACAPLLEARGNKEKAAVLRKALAETAADDGETGAEPGREPAEKAP